MIQDWRYNYLYLRHEGFITRFNLGLFMVYATKKFTHYLLANKFMPFFDHQVLFYLVNKPCPINQIVRWFAILFEFYFMIAMEKGITHQHDSHLSRITFGEYPKRVDGDILDATLFKIKVAPR